MDYMQRILYASSKAIVEHMKESLSYSEVTKIISISILSFDFGSGDDYIYKGTTNLIGLHNKSLLQLNEKQKENLEKKITDFCYSIKAVNKFFYEDGRKKVGVYIVLDKKEQLNQPIFTKTLIKIIEMSDKTRKFLYMVF